jgi:O-antigen/teichoic acid export membrane protein
MTTLKNSLWLISEKATRLILGVFVSGMLARHLGTEGFGELNYYISFVAIAIAISTMGLNRIVVRDVAREITDLFSIQKIISSSFAIRFVASFFIFIFIVTILYFFEPNNLVFYIIIFLSLFFTPFDVIEQALQGLSDFKAMSLVRLISFTLLSLLRLYLIYLGADLIYFVACVALEYMVVSIFICIVAFSKNIKFKVSSINHIQFKLFLQESLPEII